MSVVVFGEGEEEDFDVQAVLVFKDGELVSAFVDPASTSDSWIKMKYIKFEGSEEAGTDWLEDLVEDLVSVDPGSIDTVGLSDFEAGSSEVGS